MLKSKETPPLGWKQEAGMTRPVTTTCVITAWGHEEHVQVPFHTTASQVTILQGHRMLWAGGAGILLVL